MNHKRTVVSALIFSEVGGLHLRGFGIDLWMIHIKPLIFVLFYDSFCLGSGVCSATGE